MKERITLKKIANEFGVSISTVSKALNDSFEIGAMTKERIKKYAKDHNYKPNSIALSLVNKKTKTIGVIIPNIMNSFFTKVFVGIEETAAEYDYNLISCISNESYDKEVKTIDLLKNGALDGFILSIAEETQVNGNYEHFNNAINDGIPIVMFDRVANEIACDKVIVNDEEGAYQATKHLIESGCKRVALVSAIDNLSVGKLRVKGYIKALENIGIEVDNDIIAKIGSKKDFEVKIKTMLSNKSVDALLCLDENSALKSLQIVKSLNYKIPEEMSVICFSNGKLPRYVTPTISTVSQHGKEVGKMAAKMLIKRLENKGNSIMPYMTKVIKTDLIERDTTKPILFS